MPEQIDPPTALIYTMVITAAANGDITDLELGLMGRVVQTLPVFGSFDKDRLVDVGEQCAELLRREDGLDEALSMIRDALPARLRETAYALACEVIAADGRAEAEELNFLEMVRHRLGVERLIAAGIERATKARYAKL
jgi:tellurite resistance protein